MSSVCKKHTKILIKFEKKNFTKKINEYNENKNNKQILNLLKIKIKNKENFNNRNKFNNHDFIIETSFKNDPLMDDDTGLFNEEAWDDNLEEGNTIPNNRSRADRFFNVGAPNNLPNNPNRDQTIGDRENSGSDSNNSDDDGYNNNNKDSDFSEYLKKLRKELRALRILTRDKLYNNLNTTNTYQIMLKNRIGTTAIFPWNNSSINPFLGTIVIVSSLNFIIRLNRLGTLYRNPFIHLRNRIININHSRIMLTMLRNFGLINENSIYNNRRSFIIQNIFRIRNEYRNIIQIMLYLFGPVLGSLHFYKHFRKK